jgi:hypothetical protein
MAQNEILQIVVFSVLTGTAMVALGKRTAALLEIIEQIAAIMLKITGYVIACARLLSLQPLPRPWQSKALECCWFTPSSSAAFTSPSWFCGRC